jgi:hypothetical protein
MLQWKQQRKGSTALLIKGARRVGKSTIVREFAKKEYRTFVYIDFSERNPKINVLFDDLSNLDYFFMRLQQETGVTLYNRNSVVVFDEVQEYPPARQAIKHLVKDGRYDFIETGSLISIRKNVRNIIIPSEETKMTLYPLDFEEFLWAIGREQGVDMLREFYEKKFPLASAHRSTMRDLRLYMLVGGMPQAVNSYLQDNNLQIVDSVKREIIDLYDADFLKIDPSGLASMMFKNIPAQLNSNASRYLIESATEKKRTENHEAIISEMRESMVVDLAFHTTDPNIGLGMHKMLSAFKMFMSDTGLFVTLAFLDKDYTENDIYNKLLSDKLDANLGYVYENLAAQMFRAAGNELYYYTFPTETEKHNYEIDFLLSRKNKLVPVEIKSSGYKSHKSLDMFCEKYSQRVGDRILLYTKDYQKDGATLCLPIYFAPFI